MSPHGDTFNEDELHAPQWMNAEFFAKVLRESEKDDTIDVKSIKMSPASAKGDHYASVMFRAGVEYLQRGEPKSKSLIIKTMPEMEGQKKDMLGESHIFHTENAMYTEVLAKFEGILKTLGENIKLGAPCVYTSLEPKQLIIFEDAVPLGYTVVRNRKLNMEESKAAYLKLAKIHAISYKLNLEQPAYFDKYRHGLLTISQMTENEFFTEGCDNFISMIEGEPELHEYKPYFVALKDNLIEKAKNSFTEYRDNRQESTTYVLCHGDFHFKNMMVKHHPSGKVDDVMLLDFQMSYVGPIVNDLIYSFYMLLSHEQRLRHFDELLYYYFSNFVDTLKRLGFEGQLPKLSDFKRQMMEQKYFDFFLLTNFLPMWHQFTEGKVDVDDMMNSHENRMGLYKNKHYIDEVKSLLQRYKYLGYLEN